MARLLAQDTSLNRDRLGSSAGRRKIAHVLKQAWNWFRLLEPEEELYYFGYLVKHDVKAKTVKWCCF